MLLLAFELFNIFKRPKGDVFVSGLTAGIWNFNISLYSEQRV